jgi:hypothetical protein
MSAATSLALRQKLEAAVRAYLLARVADAGTSALTGVSILLRQEVSDFRLPRVICEATRAPAFEDMNELYMVEFLVALGTDAQEATASDRHTLRTGLLTEWLADRPSFLAFVNEGARPWVAPAPTPSGPPIPGLLAHDILLQDEQGEQVNQGAAGYWLEACAYLIPAQLVST